MMYLRVLLVTVMAGPPAVKVHCSEAQDPDSAVRVLLYVHETGQQGFFKLKKDSEHDPASAVEAFCEPFDWRPAKVFDSCFDTVMRQVQSLLGDSNLVSRQPNVGAPVSGGTECTALAETRAIDSWVHKRCPPTNNKNPPSGAREPCEVQWENVRVSPGQVSQLLERRNASTAFPLSPSPSVDASNVLKPQREIQAVRVEGIHLVTSTLWMGDPRSASPVAEALRLLQMPPPVCHG